MTEPYTSDPHRIDANHDWRPTPINWDVSFPRSPQHLSNQLRGKRFNADRPQLELFDDTYQRLPTEVRKDVDKHNIAVVGFDLSIAQQRGYEAGILLVTATGARTQRIVITPDDWLKAYGVEKRPRNTRNKSEMSSYERDEAFTALASLAIMPWLISYDAYVGGRWKTRQEVATLWQVGTEKDKDAPQPGRPAARPMTAQDIAQVVQGLKSAERIAIRFHDIWFDQHESFYFYKPAHLYQRLGLAITGNIRRHNKHTHAFIDWIFSEVGRIRLEERRALAAGEAKTQVDWTFSEDLTALALQLRMTAQVSKRNWGRLRKAITDSAILAQQAQIISAHEWRDDRLFITFNEKTFTDLDEYQQAVAVRRKAREQRRQRRQPPALAHDGVQWPYPRPIADYSPTQLKEMKLGQLAELDKLRQKLRSGASFATDYQPRTPTAEEEQARRFHAAVITMLDDALVPKPPRQS